MPQQAFTLDWQGDHADQVVTEAARQGLARGAELIRATAVPLTPIRDGILRGSAGTDVADDEATIFFDTPYAVEQHENLFYNHREGGAKYLERAADEAGSDAIDLVEASIRRALR